MRHPLTAYRDARYSEMSWELKEVIWRGCFRVDHSSAPGRRTWGLCNHPKMQYQEKKQQNSRSACAEDLISVLFYDGPWQRLNLKSQSNDLGKAQQ